MDGSELFVKHIRVHPC